jgi:uncharacterized protein
MERLFACDPAKRALLLSERHFDLLDMGAVFADPRRLDYPDNRFAYGEPRRITICWAVGSTFTVVVTMRGPLTWLITAWPSNRKERARYGAR